jgi:esterase
MSNLFFRKYGNGNETLVILHGLFGLSDNWTGIARQLSDRFTVFVPDMPNHGQSFFSETVDYMEMSLAIQHWLEQQEISNPIVLGHSMGGKVALHMGCEGKVPIAKLIIIDIANRNYALRDHQMLIEQLMKINPESLATRSDINAAIEQHISDIRLQQLFAKNIQRTADNRFAWNLILQPYRIPSSSLARKSVFQCHF